MTWTQHRQDKAQCYKFLDFVISLGSLTQTAHDLQCLEVVRSWVHSVLVLLYIHRQFSASSRALTWKKRLLNRNITPLTYSFDQHTAKHVVYLKLSTSFAPSYVGMTSKSKGREGSRKRKMRQIDKDRMVQTELSLRWWHRSNSYQTYCTIAVYVAQGRGQAAIKEHVLIGRWQPELNFPWVMKLRMTSSPSWGLPPPTYRAQGRKLWQKVRKRHHTTKTPWMPLSAQEDRKDARSAWTTHRRLLSHAA